MVKITIPGRAVPAVRMTQRGKFVKSRAQKYLAYRDQVALCARAAGVEPLRGNIAIKIKVYLHGGIHGDWDNYAKAICDGLTGIAYKDDKQIIKGEVYKVLHTPKSEQKTEVWLSEILD